jgi:hypothetical protein
MRSGWPSEGRNWDQDFYRAGHDQLTDRQFVQKTFVAGPALVAKKATDGYRVEEQYRGEAFDPEEFELVEGRWDHHHCIVCYFELTPGFTYWENAEDLMVCDVCYAHVTGTQRNAAG